MRTPLGFISVSVLALTMFLAPPSETIGQTIGTGPAVGSNFELVDFRTPAGDPAVYVAWRDAGIGIRSGAVRLDDGMFTPFPVIQTGYLTNLSVGAGGPAGDRRTYVTWVDSQLELVLAVFDDGGALLGPPGNVGSSVQIARTRLAGTESGVLIGHVWDSNPFWDPRILEVNAAGAVLGLEVAENVGSPEQTLAATVEAEPDGTHGIAYVTSDTREVRLRRYESTGPIDASPVAVSGDVPPDMPLSTLFTGATVPSMMLLAFPYQPAGSSPDVRFALAPLSTAGPVSLGPTMSQLVPGFSGTLSDLKALAGPGLRAVAVWQEIEFQDPETCLCSVPSPVRVDFFVQVLDVGVPVTAEGPPFLVYRWEDGDALGLPISEPSLIVASETPGTFTLVWSDGQLRYLNVGLSALAAGPEIVAPAPTASPNPFTGATTLLFSLAEPGPVLLTVVDVTGRQVARLLDEPRPEGLLAVTWAGTDARGTRVPPGIYFARLVLREQTDTVKLVRLK